MSAMAQKFASSRPPPRPKISPMFAAVATTSVSFHGAGVWPSTLYSAGRRWSGSAAAAVRYALTPAT